MLLKWIIQPQRVPTDYCLTWSLNTFPFYPYTQLLFTIPPCFTWPTRKKKIGRQTPYIVPFLPACKAVGLAVICICFAHPTTEVYESSRKWWKGRAHWWESHYSWASEMMNKSREQSGGRVPFDKWVGSPHDLFRAFFPLEQWTD